VTGIVLVAALLAACSGGSESPPGTSADKVIGGSVSVLGTWEGTELESFRAMVAPFEERTGIRVDYSATRDLEGVLDRGLQAGTAPDVAILPSPAQLADLARKGVLKDLADVLDVGAYKSETAPAFVELGSVDGRLVGVFVKSAVKGLLWFNPQVYRMGTPASWDDLQQTLRQITTDTTRPWCIGLGSGAASGWPGTDWIEDFLLRQSGPDTYDAWVAGRLEWTSPEVRRAFEAYGRIVAEGAIAGGVKGALTTDFRMAGRPLFAEPPGCVFMHGGSFMAPFLTEDPRASGSTIDFLPFPEIEARQSGSVIGAGDLAGLLADTPQARALMRYLVTSEAQSIWVRRGGALSGNIRVTDYPDRLSQRAAEVLTGAKRFRFDASDSMPQAMNEAFWQAVLDFTQDQTRLSEILEHLDAIRRTAYDY